MAPGIENKGFYAFKKCFFCVVVRLFLCFLEVRGQGYFESGLLKTFAPKCFSGSDGHSRTAAQLDATIIRIEKNHLIRGVIQ